LQLGNHSREVVVVPLRVVVVRDELGKELAKLLLQLAERDVDGHKVLLHLLRAVLGGVRDVLEPLELDLGQRMRRGW
jgi:hypothetical protein